MSKLKETDSGHRQDHIQDLKNPELKRRLPDRSPYTCLLYTSDAADD